MSQSASLSSELSFALFSNGCFIKMWKVVGDLDGDIAVLSLESEACARWLRLAKRGVFLNDGFELGASWAGWSKGRVWVGMLLVGCLSFIYAVS